MAVNLPTVVVELPLEDAALSIAASLPRPADTQRAVADTERTKADTERTKADTERAIADTERAVADTERAIADTERAIAGIQRSKLAYFPAKSGIFLREVAVDLCR